MKKVIFQEVNKCDECPYYHMQSEVDDWGKWDTWYECGFTDNILMSSEDLIEYNKNDKYGWEIPNWCPLENYDLFHKAISIVKDDA